MINYLAHLFGSVVAAQHSHFPPLNASLQKLCEPVHICQKLQCSPTFLKCSFTLLRIHQLSS